MSQMDYDGALKLLLHDAASLLIRLLAGTSITRWVEIELPKAQTLRMDLLGEDPEGELHHFELQSTNDPEIDLRMAEYSLGTYRLKFPNQVLFYVGSAPMTMPSELRGKDFLTRYRIVDVRDLDGERCWAAPMWAII
ncbi:MAG: hypothetical protein K2X03_23360 [Bryobacteraceae bacterium]|nr:hypothetical protein [Bryobacteraceae bacterium]